jgi:hypothetical protein
MLALVKKELIALKQRLTEKIKAIDILLADDEDGFPNASSIRNGAVAAVRGSLASKRRFSPSEAVSVAYDSVNNRFTTRELLDIIGARFPGCSVDAKTISGPMRRLAKKGKLRVFKEGSGSEPHIWEKIETTKTS